MIFLKIQEHPRLDPSGQEMIEFIQRICDNIGPRISGSEGERRAGDVIYNEMKEFSDEVSQEEFKCHPQGFLDFIWITTGVYITGALAYFYINPLLSAFLVFLGFLVYFAQQNLLYEVVDFVFPKKTSFHVLGKIKPKEEPRKLLLLSGHHDSAYEFPLFSKLGKKTLILILPLFLIGFLNILFSFLKMVFLFLRDYSLIIDPIHQSTVSSGIDIIQIVLFTSGTILLLIFCGYLRSNKEVLGANDNLSAVAAVLECGRFFSRHRPKQTEVWLISFAGEEHMRGSKRFVSSHQKELQQHQAMLLNLECLSAEVFFVATAENMFLAKHSSIVVERVILAAKKVNVPVKSGPLRFGGSDAANFSRRGFLATTLFGFANNGIPLGWHTLNDTPDRLVGPSIASAAEIILQFVLDVDNSD
ncbi:MAG: M28 family metallopeptidase [Candidatus Hodarchaeales archaeon]